MDKYKAVEYLFDWRAARPSFDETVFCREMGTWDDDDEVEALERCGMTATDMLGSRVGSDERSHRFGTRPESHAALVRRVDTMVLCCWVRRDCINYQYVEYLSPLVVRLSDVDRRGMCQFPVARAQERSKYRSKTKATRATALIVKI